ncbi:MAG: hypothetical protein COS62_06910 [Zetaproteobacteria bacterium CG03_land_8_20_14_0_80_59_51]|nr:MAG: hypothetical protein COS62_06910 [Zetaproteobacteria bacterium CG03_land_8_20_14_0_80_59_51]
MEISILIAQIAAVMYLAVSLGAFLNRDYFRKIIEDFYGNAGLTYIGGFMALVTGALIVHFHNHWVSDWTLLVTLLGWLALIKGVLIIIMPEQIHRSSRGLMTNSGIKVFPFVTLLLGLLFAYFGFMQPH